MNVLGWLACSLGTLILLIAALGLLRLPDALTRQHAATKAATLGVSLFAIGSALLIGDAAWSWRIVVLLGLLFVTLPIASHALARAAVGEAAASEDAAAPPESRPPH
jgi:multicomponent Na+:H+ antiporter subunit G